MILKSAASRLFPVCLVLGLTAIPAGAQEASGTTALARCLAQAGAPDNHLPISAEKLDAIRAAQAACDAAIADGTATAEVHFLIGMLQQSEGALALAMDHFRQAAWLAMQPDPGTALAGPAADAATDAPEVETTAEAEGMVQASVPETPEDEAAPESAAEAGSETAPEPDAAPEPAVQAALASEPEKPAAQPPGAADFAGRPPLEGCTALAGPPDSGVPVSPAALEASLNALKLARPFCERAVADGSADAAAYFQLAVLLQAEGAHQQALEYFTRAAEMGLAAAHSKLGDYFLFGIGPIKPDLDRAVAHYQQAEAGGDLAATTTMAFLYRLGRGVPRDPARMLELMQRAADGGYQFAQYRLAQTYLSGDGIPGGADAALGVPDPKRGAKYLEMAARQGNSKAILELAQLYATDDGGVARNLQAHAFWTRKAAETGDPAAIAALGLLYETGTGVERDPARAAALYIEALESGKVSFANLRSSGGRQAPPWDKDTARAFQLILQERGLYDGAIDGVVGPITRAAAGRVAGQ